MWFTKVQHKNILGSLTSTVLSVESESWTQLPGTIGHWMSCCPPPSLLTHPILTAPICCWTYGTETSTTSATSLVVGGKKPKLGNEVFSADGKSLIVFINSFPAAQSFPIAMLSRTMNPYSKEVLEYVSFSYYTQTICQPFIILMH